ncbi:ATP-binding protein [Actinokineospora bangkokensis]|uniref:HTH luxR-type domain-containing protein n=1 Tax=Actinokineospora bangkokensis TaxID=1193682 RepID=A0A1Q9LKK5_9PSEU|nr:LuxR C-terminal-related transcriptional regulator [Actinokineospora bangkokensis]OLR92581.1 hypothetical protein BJP25_21240 [Actinokineospora bangkokensis]
MSDGDRLPASWARLIGREEDLAQGAVLVAEHPVVALVGPGGVGKTRLAAELVRRPGVRELVDEVVEVLLHGVEAALVRTRVLQALGVPHNLDDNIDTSLAARLGQRRVLVVLDNVEHVLVPVREVLETLRRASPEVRVLVTSQALLDVGEHVLHVDPLSTVAPPGQVPDAVRLLVDRLAARGQDHDPHDPRLAQLCARVGGLALGVEHAARLLVLYTVDELLGPDGHVALLGRVPGVEQDSHRSLTELMERSAGMLTVEQRKLWAILAECRGRWSRDTAVGLGRRLGFSAPQVIAALHDLVQTAIVRRVPGDRPLFDQLPTLSLYGQGLVFDDLDRDAIRDAHAAHFTEAAAGHAARWYGPDEVSHLLRVIEHGDDHAAAVAHLTRSPVTVGAAVDLVLNLARTRAHVFRGRLWEMSELTGRALSANAALRPDNLGGTHLATVAMGAWISYCQGRLQRGHELLAQAYDLHEHVGGPVPRELALAAGVGRWLTGDRVTEREAAAALAAAADDADAEIAAGVARPGAGGDAAMLRLFACLSAAFSKLPGAAGQARAYLAATEEAGAQWAMSWAAFVVALAEHQDRRPAHAAEALRLALRTQHAMSDAWGLTWSVYLAAAMAATRGQVEQAARLQGAMASMLRAIGTDLNGLPPWSRIHQAATALCLTELGGDRTRALVSEGQRLSRDATVDLALEVIADLEPAPAPGHGLRPRELEVAQLVTRGLTNRAIARQLGISQRTVDSHVGAILRKTGAANRTELVVLMGTAAPEPPAWRG